MKLFKSIALVFAVVLISGCNNEISTDFTGNEITIPMIAGEVQGNTTSGIITIKERTDGLAQIEIIVENVLPNASHPIHLHYGSLDDNGNIATLLSELQEINGIGKIVSILTNLENGEQLTYSDFILMDGSIKIHFEASGPLEDALIASTNIGINQPENKAYIEGNKSITECNSAY